MAFSFVKEDLGPGLVIGLRIICGLFTPEPSITLPREIADRKRPKVRPGFEEIRASVLGASPELEFLKTGPRSNPERAVLFYLGRERAGMCAQSIGRATCKG